MRSRDRILASPLIATRAHEKAVRSQSFPHSVGQSTISPSRVREKSRTPLPLLGKALRRTPAGRPRCPKSADRRSRPGRAQIRENVFSRMLLEPQNRPQWPIMPQYHGAVSDQDKIRRKNFGISEYLSCLMYKPIRATLTASTCHWLRQPDLRCSTSWERGGWGSFTLHTTAGAICA